ncbi:MAG: hypothetical protein ACAH12_03435 [Methylophilaceae bacterium]
MTIPSTEEMKSLHITKIHGVAVDFNNDDAGVDMSSKLESTYSGHLILIQSGKFLRGYNRTAYALHKVKNWQLMLAGSTKKPHLQVGFPLPGYQKRLWPIVHEFGIPYLVALGNHADGYTLYTSKDSANNLDTIRSISDEIVYQVIADLQSHKKLNQAVLQKKLGDPETAGFQLKEKAQALDDILLQDITKLTRELRTTWGESVRVCLCRLMHNIFSYGQEDNKPLLLKRISADVDQLNHYIQQAQKLKQFKSSNFEHRAVLVVELGRIVGGLIRTRGGDHV